MDPDKILLPYEKIEKTKDTWDSFIRLTIEGKYPKHELMFSRIMDYEYKYKRYVCWIHPAPPIGSLFPRTKRFFFLKNAKKYLDNQLKSYGYILIDDPKKVKSYKLLL
jgi:hypothetical protein